VVKAVEDVKVGLADSAARERVLEHKEEMRQPCFDNKSLSAQKTSFRSGATPFRPGSESLPAGTGCLSRQGCAADQLTSLGLHLDEKLLALEALSPGNFRPEAIALLATARDGIVRRALCPADSVERDVNGGAGAGEQQMSGPNSNAQGSERGGILLDLAGMPGA